MPTGLNLLVLYVRYVKLDKTDNIIYTLTVITIASTYNSTHGNHVIEVLTIACEINSDRDLSLSQSTNILIRSFAVLLVNTNEAGEQNYKYCNTQNNRRPSGHNANRFRWSVLDVGLGNNLDALLVSDGHVEAGCVNVVVAFVFFLSPNCLEAASTATAFLIESIVTGILG